MTGQPDRPRRCRPGGARHPPSWLGLLVLALAACGSPPPTAPADSTTLPRSGIRSSASGSPTAKVVARGSAPTGIEIPAIGVSAGVVRLGLDRDGSMEVPDDVGLTGWFTGGPAPGETGPAVIAGHVDSRRGPAVFYRLRDLQPGDEVTVERADGTALRFTVDGIAQYPKRAFPTAAVFGPTPEPLLRLITCGGTFDRSVRSYQDNVVVTALLAAP